MPERDPGKTEMFDERTSLEGVDAGAADAPDWQPGQRLGPFRLKHRLGKGGMGMVWLAEQFEPLRRDVAIKVLLDKRRSPMAEAYFEVERQMLAQLSHRAIAQIFDAGRLPDGGLYFVMEYVPGVPLHNYLAENRLTLQALAGLFIEICSGLQHAHQRGLIHRDIKPQNILARTVDGIAQPKIIDFGIALNAAAGDSGPESSRASAGTRGWMAPEQNRTDEHGIDVRTDVYLIGLVLAQAMLLVSGESGRQARAMSGDALRDGLMASLTGPAGDAAETSGAFAALPRELRAIAARALATERDQRYDSAAAMAEDLRRWLKHEPVEAAGGGRLYKVQCFLRRNALASIAATGITISLVAGIVLALHGMNEAREGRAEAETARALAEQRRDDAEELIRFMLGDFAAGLRSIGRLELLDGIGSEALRYLTAQQAGDDPESALNRARALRTLGEVQVQRQQFDAAEEPLREAAALLAPFEDTQDPELTEIHFESGQIAFWRGVIAYRQQDLETTEHHWQHYLRAARGFSETTDDPIRARQEMGYALNNLGTLAEARLRLDEALDHFSQARRYWRELVDSADGFERNLANNLSWLGRIQSLLGRHADAWNSASEALELVIRQRADAPDDARLRQAEINFRKNRANISMALELYPQAANDLQAAFPLAQQDVANDPTQTGRQVALAEIAFSLAALPGTSRPQALEALRIGRDAVTQAIEQGLNPNQSLELPAMRWRTELQLGNRDGETITAGSEALAALVRNMGENDPAGAIFIRHIGLAGDLVTLLVHASGSLDPEVTDTLLGILDEVPQPLQGDLRIRLARADLVEIKGSDPALAAALHAEIARRREQFRQQLQLAGES
ncbi:MAG: protein kinase domain-containing protein [Wenzhouxiangella sp.]